MERLDGEITELSKKVLTQEALDTKIDYILQHHYFGRASWAGIFTANHLMKAQS